MNFSLIWVWTCWVFAKTVTYITDDGGRMIFLLYNNYPQLQFNMTQEISYYRICVVQVHDMKVYCQPSPHCYPFIGLYYLHLALHQHWWRSGYAPPFQKSRSAPVYSLLCSKVCPADQNVLLNFPTFFLFNALHSFFPLIVCLHYGPVNSSYTV